MVGEGHFEVLALGGRGGNSRQNGLIACRKKPQSRGCAAVAPAKNVDSNFKDATISRHPDPSIHVLALMPVTRQHWVSCDHDYVGGTMGLPELCVVLATRRRLPVYSES